MDLDKAQGRMPRMVIVLCAAILSMVLVALLVGTAGAQEQPNGSNGGVSDSTVVSTSDVTSSSVSNFEKYKTVYNTDFTSAGFGGMRNNGTGTINLSGITGPVTEAYLVWQGPTNTSDPLANANVTFAGNPITGENIGFSHDNCWGFSNSQGYRADVTSLVTGNGSYTLGNFVKPTANINGVSLLVFFDDGNQSNNRDVVLFTGNDSNSPNIYDADGWNVSLPGIDYAGGDASIQMHVSDGQVDEGWLDDTVYLNNQELASAGNIFSGDSVPNGPFNLSGGLWDIKNFDVTSFLTPGDNTLNLTTGLNQDCLSLVVAAIDLPAGAAPEQPNQPPTAEAGGPYEVNEGSSVQLSGSGTDNDGTIASYAWDLDNDGQYDDSTNQNPTFSAANLDGPSSHTVGLQVTDDDGATGTETATVQVNNVAPTISGISASVQNALSGKNVTFTGMATDPSQADSNAGFFWQWSTDGINYTPSSLPNPPIQANSNQFTTSFENCGSKSVSAKASDKDGGTSAPVNSDSVNVYNASYLAPLNEGVYNTVQAGRVIPVKISVGCAGDLTGLQPSIQLLKGEQNGGEDVSGADNVETLSSSAADTTGIMRAIGGGYIYNLQVPSTAKAPELYTIRVNPFGGNNASSNMYIVLKIRK